VPARLESAEEHAGSQASEHAGDVMEAVSQLLCPGHLPLGASADGRVRAGASHGSEISITKV
jgi:hypothetical protein